MVDRGIVSGGCYYDRYTLLTQLGHVPPLGAAAKATQPPSQKGVRPISELYTFHMCLWPRDNKDAGRRPRSRPRGLRWG